jgi:hypothetical protein
MTHVSPSPLPPGALLQRYADSGDFVDCFTCTLAKDITLTRYIEAFFSSPAFWAERQGLKLMNFHPSDRNQVTALAHGGTAQFSAWHVEERTSSQLLLCDVKAQTRSWLMVDPLKEGSTQLYFGSAIIKQSGSDASPKMPLGFRILMSFHDVYSRTLLKSAVKGL